MRRKDAQPKIKKQRAWEIDFLRGFAIIMVVWDHTLFDLGYIFGDYWMSSGYAGLPTRRSSPKLTSEAISAISGGRFCIRLLLGGYMHRFQQK